MCLVCTPGVSCLSVCFCVVLVFMQARSRNDSAARASVAVGAALLLLAMVALVSSGSSNADGALVEKGKTESQSLYSKVKNHESEVDAGERLVPLII